jgi:thiamine monophosphate synthase
VQFRRKGEMVEEWADTIEQLQHLVHSYGGRLLVNTHPLAGEKLHCDGIHLASGYLMSLTRKPSGFDWVAASVHTPEEIVKANALGVDLVVISPVLPTASHPGEPPLGWEAFADLAAQAQMPVYALGGMQPVLLPMAQQQGGLGIAGIRFQWPES